ncbi:CCA tRNA nucleotidyltransferase [Sphingomonas oligoaromativorans]|uniref:CCA tRNA nucleotidyltransferase n=1 Tax=Sphingomonas oligoaromativorans TaxID=575322 RepID=UPI00141F7432|nr:CCA tRNA nucleotidyltransferase [Sphingomonas oligoaromativorans]NIJ34172.1 poly(A) polymerase [Sphingomonas oligoaromativorans]
MTARAVPVPPPVTDPQGLERLIEALDGAGGATRYIGGWVRDTLLGQAPQDIDVATRLSPQEVESRAQAAGLNTWSSASGIAHGTIGVVVGGKSFEVTTLRRDVATDGRHATVAFTEDWQEDAARRDFTINALSADPLTGEVHDYFGGLDDLAEGRVRFIGEPAQRIAEDHLRILRFFRFHARFGKGTPDAASYAACVARAKDLMALSRERIAAELVKLLAVADPLATVEAMLEGGLFAPVVPEITDAARLAALLSAERAAGVAPDGLRRLAALLPPSPVVAEQVAARLRLSKLERKRLALAAEPDGTTVAERQAYAIGVESAVDRLLLADEPQAARRIEHWQRPSFPLSGGDLIAMGLTAGPAVATTLRAIEQRWVREGFPAKAVLDGYAREAVTAVVGPAG